MKTGQALFLLLAVERKFLFGKVPIQGISRVFFEVWAYEREREKAKP